MSISKLIMENVRDSRLKKYLKKLGVTILEDEKDMDFSSWLSKQISDGRVSEEIVNDCLFEELSYGHRRLLRYYELVAVRKIKRVEDWQGFLDDYNCPSLNFNNIISTVVHSGETLKVCAMKTEEVQGIINTVDILFVYRTEVYHKANNSRGTFYSYIPVSFDLKMKTMDIKIWNKDDIVDGDLPKYQLDYVVENIMQKLNITTKPITLDPQKILYKMSKVLFDEFFEKLPNNSQVECKRENIPDIIYSFLNDIDLNNSENINGLKTMNKEVINVEEEMYKLLQQVALYDYLKDNNIKTLLENTDRYISRVRFSDRDNLTASLTSESGVKCIFDAKTFMCVRNSLDLVQKIVSIVVSFVNNSSKGLLSVKYDASDRNYLCIHILQNRYYTKDDYKMIKELYKQYESDDAEISVVYNEDNAEAM